MYQQILLWRQTPISDDGIEEAHVCVKSNYSILKNLISKKLELKFDWVGVSKYQNITHAFTYSVREVSLLMILFQRNLN